MDDIRWKQRLKNFTRALAQLEMAVRLSDTRPLTDLEKQGLIQAFEFTHELSWNVMKDYFEYQGSAQQISGSRDATREAFLRNLIEDGQNWMEMLKSRNQSSHTYNSAVAEDICVKIQKNYCRLFKQFEAKMNELSAQ